MIRSLGWICALFFASLLAFGAPCAAAAAEYALAPPPTWVDRGTGRPDVSVSRASDGIRYLLSDDQVNLTGAKPVWYRRVGYQIEEARSLASAGQITIDYQPEYQVVQIHSIDLYRDGAKEDRRGQAHIQMLRREADLESGLLDGMHTLNITIPDLKVGDRVDYSFSIIGYNSVFGADYYDAYTASFSEPLGFKRVKAIYPAERPLRWRIGHPGFRVVQGGSGGVHYVDISGSNLAKVEVEADTPDSFDPYGRIEISTADSWNHVARWAAAIYPDRFADRALAAALAKTLRLDPGDAMGSLTRAVEYVQGEIRYTGLDMGENSHAPHAPESTVARRFGDCKDKAVLLVALLREAGIRARPVLVNTVKREAIKDYLPSAGVFDHVVVSADVGGRTYWIDATRDVENGDMASRDPLPFRLGLPVADSVLRLSDIPYPRSQIADVDVGQLIRISERGDEMRAEFTVVTDYRGLRADGMKVNFRSQGEVAIGKQYLDYMRGFYDNLSQVEAPRIQHLAATPVARTTERYRLDWKRSEDGDAFAIVLFQIADWIPILTQDSRNQPLALGGPRFARQTVRTRIDNGWSLRNENDTVRNPYFTFSRSLTVEGRSLLIVGEWRRLADQVPAKDYPQLRKDLKRARDLLEFNIDLSSDYSDVLDTGFRAWLLPLTAIAALGLSLLAFWLLRVRIAFAGMFFAPRASVPPKLAADSLLPGTLALILAMAIVDTAIDHGSEYLLQPDAMHLGKMVGGVLGFFVRFFLYVLFISWAFRLLSKRIPYRTMTAAAAWGAFPPLLLFVCCGLLAVGFDIQIFAKTYVAEADQMPGILVAAAMATIGLCWSLIGSINTYSVAAGTSRRFALGALGIAFLVALFVFFPLALLISVAK